MAHELLLQGPQLADPAHTGVAQPAQGQGLLLEQALETIHRRHHQQVFALAASLVAAQQLKLTGTLTPGTAGQDFFRQDRYILQAQIDALAGKRVNGVGGIGYQRYPGLHVVDGVTLAQGKRVAARTPQHPAQPALKGALQFSAERGFVQREQIIDQFLLQRPD